MLAMLPDPFVAPHLVTERSGSFYLRVYPSGYETIGACRSLIEIFRLQDPMDAMSQFFRECVNGLKTSAICQEFLALGPNIKSDP
ncbi:hypothetical protein WME94_52050 [Sorangium sp. So ce429]